MIEVFCDTLYFKALADRHDQYHEQALELTDSLSTTTLVSTHEVFVESLNFLSGYGPALRAAITALLEGFCSQSNAVLQPLSQDLFHQGWQLYRARLDKSYSLTDCISMTVMEQRGIAQVLTHDSHFRQEGFVLMLK